MSICVIDSCDNEMMARGYCHKHYNRWRKYGNPLTTKKKWNEPLNFIINDNGCFIVISHKQGTNGYPQLRYNRRPTPAHRKVYEECFGLIPKGLQVRHKCDNRQCINPEHLELGTFKDNMNDKLERNRQAIGEMNGQSKLTEQDVIEIKKQLNSRTNKEIAQSFKISPQTICDIKYGRCWKHVNLGG